MSKKLQVTCPICKKLFVYHESAFRPFCTERCRLLDLGSWLNESYAVGGEKISPESVPSNLDLEEESPSDFNYEEKYEEE